MEDNLKDFKYVKHLNIDDDIIAENSLKKSNDFAVKELGEGSDSFSLPPSAKIKLELLRELNNDVIGLGKSQITKTWVFDWVDQQKLKLNRSLNAKR